MCVSLFLGACGAWSVIVILLNMAALLTESELLTPDESAYVTMGILMGYTVILMILDVLMARRMLSTMFTPYCLAVCFYAMIMYKWYWKGRDKMFTMAAICLSISSMFLLIKVIVALARACVCTWKEDGSCTSDRKYEEEQALDYGAVAYENNSGPSSRTGSIGEDTEEMASNTDLWSL